MSPLGDGAAAVDDDGVWLRAPRDAVVDVHFNGTRVWSFWPHRDGGREPGTDVLLTPWPGKLRPFLDGACSVRVGYHDAERLWEGEQSFGAGVGRVAVADRTGHPLGIDSSGRLVRTFETRAAGLAGPILDALERVLAALSDAGVPAFPAYGTLLGAVRNHALIAHDSDTDVGYLSAHSQPVDVIRESFRLERVLRRAGFGVTRYSGAAFRVDVAEADGTRRGLDVFAGFLLDGNLVLVGEIMVPFRREWLVPLGTVELEGRVLPAPAHPERLLEVTYGPSWRVPDPAFTFHTPASTSRRLNLWFRGTRAHRGGWDGRYHLASHEGPRRRPHDLVTLLAEQSPIETTVIDVGCGRGQDVFWLAGQGRPAWGLDYSPGGFEWLAREAEDAGLPAHYHQFNILELRQVLAWGARFARLERPRAIMARHLVDATSPWGRVNLWRLARVVLRGGGRLYLDFLTELSVDSPWGRSRLEPVDPALVVEQVGRWGGTVEWRETGFTEPVDLGYGPEAYVEGAWEVCRMVVRWP